MEKTGSIAIMILTAMIFLIVQIAIVLNPWIIMAFPAFIRAYIAIHIPYIAAFIVIAIGARFMHTSVLAILCPRIRAKSIIIAVSIYVLLLAINDIAYSASISATGVSAAVFLAELIAVMILTPLQAAAEELFFRALPLRIGYGSDGPDKTIKALPFIVFAGFFFLLPHLGNREVNAASSALLPAIYYFSWGALAAWLGAASGEFGTVAAMHAVNNIHIALIVNYESSSMMTEALFINSLIPSDAISIILLYVAFGAIYIALERSGCIKEGFRING